MKEQNALALLKKYQQGNCTEEELHLLRSWFHESSFEKAQEVNEAKLAGISAEIWEKVQLYKNNKQTISKMWPRLAAAAILLIICTAGLLAYIDQSSIKSNHQKMANVMPATSKATLTLADGKIISLTDVAAGEIVHQSGIHITKTETGQLIYTVIPDKNRDPHDAEQMYHIISTPKGGRYQVNLPDGSKVWLNSASSLKYPVVFAGNERKIELKGEAYFEIETLMSDRGDHKIPFKVSVYRSNGGKHTVEVLGTHFNINSYEDEPLIKTTLLEGSVRISVSRNAGQNGYGIILKPGEQSNFKEGVINISKADIAHVMAWKNGLFMFKDDELKDVMKEVSRWYDIDIDEEAIPDLHFNGTISRQDNLATVLKMLEVTGDVRFVLTGRKLKVLLVNNQ